jgi:hypothetical protein
MKPAASREFEDIPLDILDEVETAALCRKAFETVFYGAELSL